MTDNQTLEKLQEEISFLKETLDKIYPNWFDDTIRDYADLDGTISESICIPIRAAIKALRQDNKCQIGKNTNNIKTTFIKVA